MESRNMSGKNTQQKSSRKKSEVEDLVPCPLSRFFMAFSCKLLYAVEPLWQTCALFLVAHLLYLRKPGSATLALGSRAHAHNPTSPTTLISLASQKRRGKLVAPNYRPGTRPRQRAKSAIAMSFSALLGVVSRASASSFSTFWPVSVAASVAPRALATLTWANSSKGSSSSRQDSDGKSQQQQQQQLMWCSLANNMRPSAAARGMEGAVAARRCCVAPRKSFSSATPVLSSKGDAGGEGVSFVETEDARRRNGDSGCVAFVTGANRGIGLEVTRQLLARTKGKLLAVLNCFNVERASVCMVYRTRQMLRI